METNDKKDEKESCTKITYLESIKENYLSWIILLISVSVISFPNIQRGMVTILISLLIAYFVHRESHRYYNIFTIVHNYHHENDNWFSHLLQILVELSSVTIFIAMRYYFGENFIIDIWIVVFFAFFYSSVHNINYSIYKVNDVHKLHHQFVNTNVGPDICDIFFGTKHESRTKVENTDHYIPNLILSTMSSLNVIEHANDKQNLRKLLKSYMNRSIKLD